MTQDIARPEISAPMHRRFRLWRQRFLPVLVWAAAIGITLVLVRQERGLIMAVGTVESRNVIVAPLVDGTVHGLSVDLLDGVESGQVVALMDDTLVTAELRTSEAELSRLSMLLERENSRLELEVSSLALDGLDDMRRFMLNEETARLDLLDRRVQQESAEVELQRLSVMLKRQEALVKEQVVEQATYDELLLRHEALRTEIEGNKAAIAMEQTRVDEAAERHAELKKQPVFNIDIANYLMPLKESIAVQETIIEEIKERRMMLALRAPLAGQIAMIVRRTGEMAIAGEPVVMIAGAASTRVIAYVGESAARDLKPGSEVTIRSRRSPKHVAMAKVVKVGTQIEEMPLRLCRSPLMAEWGFPMLIGDVPAGTFLPGELLDLQIERAEL